MMQQTSQLSVLRILDNCFGIQAGSHRDGDLGGGMGREVVEVYSFVGAAACEDDLLRLLRDRGGWR